MVFLSLHTQMVGGPDEPAGRPGLPAGPPDLYPLPSRPIRGSTQKSGKTAGAVPDPRR